MTIADQETGEETGVELTALEYRLLLLFCSNKGVVLSRNQLLQDLWDVGSDFVNDNTLTVYIKRLRDKIEKDPAFCFRCGTVPVFMYYQKAQEHLDREALSFLMFHAIETRGVALELHYSMYLVMVAAVFAVIGLSMLLSASRIRSESIIEALECDAV